MSAEVGARTVKPRRVEAPKGGAPKGGPRRVEAPEGWVAQNFALFFLSPATIFVLSSLSGCLLVEFWLCLKRRGPEMCTFGLSGCRTFQGPGASNTTKIPREDPQREKRKERNGGGRGEKKREVLGPPPFGPPPFGPPLFLGLGPWPTNLHEKKRKEKTLNK